MTEYKIRVDLFRCLSASRDNRLNVYRCTENKTLTMSVVITNNYLEETMNVYY